MTTPTQDRELLEQAANALEGMYERYAESECGRTEDAKAAAKAIRARLAQPDAIGVAGQTAKQQYEEIMTDNSEKPNALEDLRFFCSLAMSGQDWLDVEPFFDALAAPKSGDMAQGEQEASGLRMELATAMRYIEERDERIKELKAEIANLRFAIERIQTLSVRAAKLIDPILARAAASTGAVPATDASDEVWAAWDAKHSTGAGQISDAELYQYILDCDYIAAKGYLTNINEAEWKANVRAKHVRAALSAAQPKGDGK